jgi:hypothetical protein
MRCVGTIAFETNPGGAHDDPQSLCRFGARYTLEPLALVRVAVR